MPLDVRITFEDGSQKLHYIPMRMMRDEKANEYDYDMVTLNDWPWTYPTYQFPVSIEDSRIKSITIDPPGRLADVDQTDSEWPKNPDINL